MFCNPHPLTLANLKTNHLANTMSCCFCLDHSVSLSTWKKSAANSTVFSNLRRTRGDIGYCFLYFFIIWFSFKASERTNNDCSEAKRNPQNMYCMYIPGYIWVLVIMFHYLLGNSDINRRITAVFVIDLFWQYRSRRSNSLIGNLKLTSLLVAFSMRGQTVHTLWHCCKEKLFIAP